MEHYLNYTTEDFLLDEEFIVWVNKPTEAKNLQWKQWLEQHPEKTSIVNEARKLLLSLQFSQQNVDESFYQHLKQRIDNTIGLQQQRSAPVRRLPGAFKGALRIAAAITGIVAIAGGIYYFTKSPVKSSLLAVATKYGETKHVFLPDSSEVILNANSSIEYNKDFTESTREVWIKGEGYFKVRHIEKAQGQPQKFVVHNDHIKVEVLGTEFDVKDADSITAVLLANGKVLLTANTTKEQLLMKPNDLATYHKDNRTLKNIQVAPYRYLAWMQGKYVFDKASAQEICNHLQSFYGTEFIIKNNALSRQLYSGSIDLQDSATVMKTLSVLFNAKVKEEDLHITIY